MAEQTETVTAEDTAVAEEQPAPQNAVVRRPRGKKVQTLLGPVEELNDGVEQHSAQVDPKDALVVEESPSKGFNVEGPLRDNPPEGRIIEEGEPVEFEALEVGNQLVVQENVYRRSIPFNSLRVHYTLIYAKGTALPPTAAVR